MCTSKHVHMSVYVTVYTPPGRAVYFLKPVGGKSSQHPPHSGHRPCLSTKFLDFIEIQSPDFLKVVKTGQQVRENT